MVPTPRLCFQLILLWNTVSFVISYVEPKVRSSSYKFVTAIGSLKPAAAPLMEAGKAFARSGEFIIDLTTAEGLYGGALSAAGAQIRNAGDCIAQAAASCRFKTGTELVVDELREASTCLREATEKLNLAIEEAQVDQRADLVRNIDSIIIPLQLCGDCLEAAGAGIMQRTAVSAIGASFVNAGDAAKSISDLLVALSPQRKEAQDAGQRMSVASVKMTEAGSSLQGMNQVVKGKGWMKGGAWQKGG